MRLDELTQHASAFRIAIEATTTNERPIALREFPRASCGATSLLLGSYLMEVGEATFNYMVGHTTEDIEDPDWRFHAWIQRDDLIIDITADQFVD